MIGRIQHPRYTAAALAAANPQLLDGELVYESDTGRHKIGDGVKAWNALPYAGGGDFEGAIPADQVTQDTEHRFVTDAEKSAWNDVVAKDLSNVSLEKRLSTNGYYKAPDGLMFQWGVSPGGSYKYYFSPSFITTPFACFLTASYGNEQVITAASHVELTSTYLRYIARWTNLIPSNGGVTSASEKVHWLVIGRWK